MNTIYMGWDSRETVAYDVAEKSIMRRASTRVEIKPLKLDSLPMLSRPIEIRDGKLWCPISQAPMATEFSNTRFCVPFLQTEGWALFVDCDVICLTDIEELFELAEDRYAVMVVKHNHQPTATTKMDGQIQTRYPRKNWSSLILWNCSHPANKRLTVEELNRRPGRDLHAFCWLNDEEIGSLSTYWNHLVGVSAPEKNFDPDHPPRTGVVGILHYTLGGPWLPGWQGGPLDDLWLKEQACKA